ncbi:MAG TPA: hypothetical protein V6D07_14665 [Trichocoleus sp.]
MSSGSKDMLARIKARSQRPKVERDTSLSAQDTDQSAPELQALEVQSAQPIAPPQDSLGNPLAANSAKEASSSTSLDARLEQLIQVAPRRNIRLEESLDQEIERFVYEQNLTIETLLEACYLELKQNPDLQHRVLAEASKRLAERKEAGKLRRIHSQMQKLDR